MGLEALIDFHKNNFLKSVMEGYFLSNQIFAEKIENVICSNLNPITTSSQSHLITSSLYDFTFKLENSIYLC